MPRLNRLYTSNTLVRFLTIFQRQLASEVYHARITFFREYFYGILFRQYPKLMHRSEGRSNQLLCDTNPRLLLSCRACREIIKVALWKA